MLDAADDSAAGRRVRPLRNGSGPHGDREGHFCLCNQLGASATTRGRRNHPGGVPSVSGAFEETTGTGEQADILRLLPFGAGQVGAGLECRSLPGGADRGGRRVGRGEERDRSRSPTSAQAIAAGTANMTSQSMQLSVSAMTASAWSTTRRAGLPQSVRS